MQWWDPFQNSGSKYAIHARPGTAENSRLLRSLGDWQRKKAPSGVLALRLEGLGNQGRMEKRDGGIIEGYQNLECWL